MEAIINTSIEGDGLAIPSHAVAHDHHWRIHYASDKSQSIEVGDQNWTKYIPDMYIRCSLIVQIVSISAP
jgi:hypothetical protein